MPISEINRYAFYHDVKVNAPPAPRTPVAGGGAATAGGGDGARGGVRSCRVSALRAFEIATILYTLYLH